jgi:hypothetical protein
MRFTFTPGRFGVDTLTAPYGLLVKAFGNDGDNNRDDCKSMAQWVEDGDDGGFEVYDYKVGKCYDPDGLERRDITTWHVQSYGNGIDKLLGRLKEALG